jgi:hypothetical protein
MEELEASTEIEEPEEISSAAQPAATERLTATPPLRIVALKRAIGTSLDFTAIGLIAAVPGLYRLLTQNPLPTKPVSAILGDNTMFFCFCLALSPIPLIYLRLVFRKLLHSPTPGEMFAGVTTITLHAGTAGIVSELGYALTQYFTLASSAILGVLILAILIFSGILGKGTGSPDIATLALVPILSIGISSAAYWPHSQSDYQSLLENFSGAVVKRLR